MPPALHTTDILILGSGLSGLRAAWSAQHAAPDLDVTIACLRAGPSGSSFTNRNNALGYQLLDTDEKRLAFVQEAIALAAPGFIDRKLVAILAEESEPRFRELTEFSLDFRHDNTGTMTRFTGCGSRDKRAVVFDDLTHAFNQFSKKTADYGCNILTGFECMGLLTANNTTVGVWGVDEQGSPVYIRAKATIMALGGPAPLFSGHIAGAANPGLSYGLLAEAGATLANTPYLQFMWGDRSGAFANPAALLAHDNTIECEDGSMLLPNSVFGETLPALLAERSIHCPFFYGQADTQIDRLLLDQRWADGFTRVRTGETTSRVALHAHAGNGGAVVDEHGETSVHNLFALGECATGMHGANRIGGAMILATQVFGHRAGIAAAARANDTPFIPENDFHDICENGCATMGTDAHAQEMKVIGQAMQYHGLPDKEEPALPAALLPLLDSEDTRVRLAARTAQTILCPAQ